MKYINCVRLKNKPVLWKKLKKLQNTVWEIVINLIVLLCIMLLELHRDKIDLRLVLEIFLNYLIAHYNALSALSLSLGELPPRYLLII